MAVDFEALDHIRAENKARVHEERKQMKIELAKYIDKCDSYELSRLYDEYNFNWDAFFNIPLRYFYCTFKCYFIFIWVSHYSASKCK